MAYKRRFTSNSANNNDKLLQALLEKYSQESRPKAGALERILAPLVGIGSGIDAYHDARFEDKNTGILNVLKNYGKNVIQGVGTLATGTRYEDKSEQLSDILDKTSPTFKYGLGKSKIGRSVTDIAGGLVTDPLTYVSFGAAGLTDDAVKAGGKSIKSIQGLDTMADSGKVIKEINKVVNSLKGKDINTASKEVLEKLGQESADAFYVGALSKAGRAAKSGSMKAFGKVITENPKAVFAAKTLANPLGAAGEGVDLLAKKLTPEMRFKWLQTFDPVKAFAETGQEGVSRFLMDIQRKSGSVGRKAVVSVIDSGILDAYGKLSDAEKKTVAHMIEKTHKVLPDLPIIGGEGKGIASVYDEGGLTNIGRKAGVDFGEMLETGRVKKFKDVINLPSRDKDRLLTELRNGIFPQEPIKQLTAPVGKKIISNKEKLETVRMGEWFMPKNASNEMKEFLDKYMTFQSSRADDLKTAGLPTIDDMFMGYISRGNPIGYTEGFIKNRLKRDLGEDVVNKVLNDSRVKKELAGKNGYVAEKTIRKLIGEENAGVLKKYTNGELGKLIYGGGATEERVFKTLEEAQKAGLVYDDDWLKTIYKQTIRQEERLLGTEAVNGLIELKSDLGEDLYKSMPEGIATTPVIIKTGEGTKTLYTNPALAKLTDEYVSMFSSENSLNEMLTGLDKVMAKWKPWVTAKGPGLVKYHARNVTDDTVRMILDGHDVKKLYDNIELGKEVTDFNKLIMKEGREKAVKEFKAERVEKLYKELGLETNGSAIEDYWNRMIDSGTYADIGRTESEAFNSDRISLESLIGGNKVKGLREKADDILTLDGALLDREQQWRIAHFTDTFRKTGSMQAASDSVKRTLFNYNELTLPEKQVMKRIIPFYSFVKNNLKFYLGSLKDNPERIAKFKNVLDGLQSGTEGTMTEEEKASIPDYLKDEFRIALGNSGGEQRVMGNFGLSIEALNKLPLLSNKYIQDINPLLKLIVETSTGKNTFTGKDILSSNSGEAYKNRGDLIKMILGYRESQERSKSGEEYTRTSVAPMRKYLLENFPFISQLNSASNKFSKIGKGGTEGLTNLLLPVTINKYNIESSNRFQEDNKYDELYKLLQRKGIASTFQRYYIPSGIKDNLLDELNK